MMGSKKLKRYIILMLTMAMMLEIFVTPLYAIMGDGQTNTTNNTDNIKIETGDLLNPEVPFSEKQNGIEKSTWGGVPSNSINEDNNEEKIENRQNFKDIDSENILTKESVEFDENIQNAKGEVGKKLAPKEEIGNVYDELLPGENKILHFPKIHYNTGEKLDLEQLEVLVKTFNGEIKTKRIEDFIAEGATIIPDINVPIEFNKSIGKTENSLDAQGATKTLTLKIIPKDAKEISIDIHVTKKSTLTKTQEEIINGLQPGQGAFVVQPKTKYKNSDPIDLSQMEVVVKRQDGSIEFYNYEKLSTREDARINFKDGETIDLDQYSKLFDEEFIKFETEETKAEIRKIQRKNSEINKVVKNEIRVEIEGIEPIVTKLYIDSVDLNLSPKELLNAYKMANSSMKILSINKMTFTTEKRVDLKEFDDAIILLKDKNGVFFKKTIKELLNEGFTIDDRNLRFQENEIDKNVESIKEVNGEIDRKEKIIGKIDEIQGNSRAKEMLKESIKTDEELKQQRFAPVNLNINLESSKFGKLSIPITLVSKDDEIKKLDGITTSHFGLAIPSEDKSATKVIYTLTVDVNNINSITEIQNEVLNSTNLKNIIIDRIVKTDGEAEEDLSIKDPSFRDKSSKDINSIENNKELSEIESLQKEDKSKNIEEYNNQDTENIIERENIQELGYYVPSGFAASERSTESIENTNIEDIEQNNSNNIDKSIVDTEELILSSQAKSTKVDTGDKIINPMKLSKQLEAGHKYVIFIKADVEKEAEKYILEDKITLLKEGNTIEEVQKLTASYPSLNKLFITLIQGGNVDVKVSHRNEVDEIGYPTKILWTVEIEGTGLKPSNIERLWHNFTTTSDSGLGEPKLISATRELIGSTVQPEIWTPIARTEFNKGFNSMSFEHLNLNENYKYHIVVETPVVKIQDNYVLDYHFSMAEKILGKRQGQLKEYHKREAVNIGEFGNGISKPEGEVKQSQTYFLDENLSIVGKLDGYSRKVNINGNPMTADEEKKIVIVRNIVGHYERQTKIVWEISDTNVKAPTIDYKGEVQDDSEIESNINNFTVYNHQNIVEHNGYVFASVNKIMPDNYISSVGNLYDEIKSQKDAKSFKIKYGQIAQYRIEAEIKSDDDETKEHPFNSGLSGEEDSIMNPLKRTIIIKKIWADGAPPKQATFIITQKNKGGESKEYVTLEAGEKEIKLPPVYMYDFSGGFHYKYLPKIDLDIEEQNIPGYTEVGKSVSKSANELNYTFINAIESKETNKYGIQGIEHVYINQVSMTYNDGVTWYGYAGGIRGTLLVPKGFSAGEYITLKLPNKILLAERPDPTKIFFTIYAKNPDGTTDATRPLFNVYCDKVGELRFVATLELQQEAVDREVDAFFEVGRPILGEGLRSIAVNYDFNKPKQKDSIISHIGQPSDIARIETKRIVGGKETTFRVLQGFSINASSFFDYDGSDNGFDHWEKGNARKGEVTKRVNFESTINDRPATLRKNPTGITAFFYADMHNHYKHITKTVSDEGYELNPVTRTREPYMVWRFVYNQGKYITPGGTQVPRQITEKLQLGNNNTREYDGMIPWTLNSDGASYLNSIQAYVTKYGNEIGGFKPNTLEPISVLRAGGSGKRVLVTRLGDGTLNINPYGLAADETLVFTIKVKVIDNDKGKVYNEYLNSPPGGSPFQNNRIRVKYKHTTGRGAGDIENKGNRFSLRKVDQNGILITAFPATFRLTKVYSSGKRDIIIQRATANGIVTFTGLGLTSPGEWYEVEEVKAPQGYELSTIKYRIEIPTNGQIHIKKPDGTSVSTNNGIANFSNKRNTNLIRVKKVDDKGNALSGAKFTLRKIGDDGKLTGQMITKPVGKDGILTFESIADGNWTIIETGVPDGYQKPKYRIDFKMKDQKIVAVEKVLIKTEISPIKDSNSTNIAKDIKDSYFIFKTENGEFGFQVSNKLIPKNEFRVKKVDANKNPLKGAQFELQRIIEKDGKITYEPHSVQSSGEDGIVTFVELEDGKYKLTEIKPPNKYAKITKTWIVTVENGKVTYTEEKTNSARMFYSLDEKIAYTNNLEMASGEHRAARRTVGESRELRKEKELRENTLLEEKSTLIENTQAIENDTNIVESKNQSTNILNVDLNNNVRRMPIELETRNSRDIRTEFLNNYGNNRLLSDYNTVFTRGASFRSVDTRKATLDKKVESTGKPGEYQVTLTVTAKPHIENPPMQKPRDIVLVIENSRYTKLGFEEQFKIIARNFVNNLPKDVRVGVVEYNKDTKVISQINTPETVKNEINKMTPQDSRQTFTILDIGTAIRKATSMLDSSDGVDKTIVIVSGKIPKKDGKTTFAYITNNQNYIGTKLRELLGITNYSNKYEVYNFISSNTRKEPYNETAIHEYLQRVSTDGHYYDLSTSSNQLGYGNYIGLDDKVVEIAKTLKPKTKPDYSKSIVDTKIEDVINNGLTIVPDSIESVYSPRKIVGKTSATISNNTVKAQGIQLNRDETYTLKYKVQINNQDGIEYDLTSSSKFIDGTSESNFPTVNKIKWSKELSDYLVFVNWEGGNIPAKSTIQVLKDGKLVDNKEITYLDIGVVFKLEKLEGNSKYTFKIEKDGWICEEGTENNEYTIKMVKDTRPSTTKKYIVQVDWADNSRPQTAKLWINSNRKSTEKIINIEGSTTFVELNLPLKDTNGEDLTYTFEIDQDENPGYTQKTDDKNDIYKITMVKFAQEQITIPVNIDWQNKPYGPISIQIQIFKNGVPSGKKGVVIYDEISSHNIIFDKYDDYGREINYSFNIIDSKNEYFGEIGDKNNNYTIKVSKINADNIKEHTVQVFWTEEPVPENAAIVVSTNRGEVQRQIIKPAESSYGFFKLPIKDGNGNIINYKFRVDANGWASVVESDDNFHKITMSKSADINVKVSWIGSKENRPQNATIIIYANGVEVDTADISVNSETQFEKFKLPLVDDYGNKIEYSFNINAPNWKSRPGVAENGYEIFMTENLNKKTTISYNLSWDKEHTNKIPESVKIKLVPFVNGKKVEQSEYNTIIGTTEISLEQIIDPRVKFSGQFKDIPTEGANKEILTYEIRMEGANDWVTSIRQNPQTLAFEIINSRHLMLEVENRLAKTLSLTITKAEPGLEYLWDTNFSVGEKIKNAKFRMRNIDTGIDLKLDEAGNNKDLITDVNGTLTIKNIPPGRYEMYEESVAGDYVVNPTIFHITVGEDDVEIKPKGNTKGVDYKLLKDIEENPSEEDKKEEYSKHLIIIDRKRPNIRLRKKLISRKNDERVGSNILFTLSKVIEYDVNGNIIKTQPIYNSENIGHQDIEKRKLFYSDGNGIIRFRNLDPGDYVVQEEKTEVGYIKPSGYVAKFTVNKDYTVTVTEPTDKDLIKETIIKYKNGQYIRTAEEVEVNKIKNYEMPIPILVKKDREGRKLADAEFKLKRYMTKEEAYDFKNRQINNLIPTLANGESSENIENTEISSRMAINSYEYSTNTFRGNLINENFIRERYRELNSSSNEDRTNSNPSNILNSFNTNEKYSERSSSGFNFNSMSTRNSEGKFTLQFKDGKGTPVSKTNVKLEYFQILFGTKYGFYENVTTDDNGNATFNLYDGELNITIIFGNKKEVYHARREGNNIVFTDNSGFVKKGNIWVKKFDISVVSPKFKIFRREDTIEKEDNTKILSLISTDQNSTSDEIKNFNAIYDNTRKAYIFNSVPTGNYKLYQSPVDIGFKTTPSLPAILTIDEFGNINFANGTQPNNDGIYSITNEIDQEQGEWVTVGNYKTPETGLVRLEVNKDGLGIGLEPGDYRLVETKAPPGYILPKNETGKEDSEGYIISEFKVDEEGKIYVMIGKEKKVGFMRINGELRELVNDDNGNITSFYEMTNDSENIKFKFNIHKLAEGAKVDGNMPEPMDLEGAEFEIYKNYDGKLGEQISNSETGEKIWTTDDKGIITIDFLSYGKYKLVEKKAPAGYIISEGHGIKIDDNGEKYGGINFEIAYDKNTKKAYLKEEIYIRGLGTDEDPYEIEVKNKKAPILEVVKYVKDGYKLNSEGNPLKDDKGNPIFNEKPLSGVEFELLKLNYDRNKFKKEFDDAENNQDEHKNWLDIRNYVSVNGVNGSPLIFKSDAYGKFEINFKDNNLGVGVYALKEKEAPKGYLQRSEIAVFELDEKGVITPWTIFDGSELYEDYVEEVKADQTDSNNVDKVKFIYHLENIKKKEMYFSINKVDEMKETIKKGSVKFKLEKLVEKERTQVAGENVYKEENLLKNPDGSLKNDLTIKVLKTFKPITKEIDLTKITASDIKLESNEISDGFYLLTEEKAPKGYALTSGQWLLEIKWEEDKIILHRYRYTADGIWGKPKIKRGTREKEVESIILYEKNNAKEISRKFEVVNYKTEFPETGGYGSVLFTFSGMTLMAAAYIINRRKRVIE